MFDIRNYDILTSYYFFCLFIIIYYIFFKRKISSLIDDLFYHIIWLSAQCAFLFVFMLKHGVSIFSVIFIVTLISYIVLMRSFLSNIRKRESISFDSIKIEISDKKLLTLLFISLIILLFSRCNLLYHFITHNPSEWVLYRFVELQGRNPLLSIISLGIGEIFHFLIFYLIFIRKKYKFILFLILFFVIFLSLLAGGRSTLLLFLFDVGTFIYFYRMNFTKAFINRIQIIGVILIPIALLLASVISSLYNLDYNLMDGLFIIFNRIIASADGLEYYMLYGGYEKIEYGIVAYLLSIFGIYLKKIIDIEHKNIGHQLSELVAGNLDFAQGSNYVLPLQVMVIGFYLMPIYVFIVSFLTAKMRNLTPKSRNLKEHLIKYFFVQNSFFIVTDPEYGILVLVSFLLVYSLLFCPILVIINNQNFLCIKK